MKQHGSSFIRLALFSSLLALASLSAACGGGGGGDDDPEADAGIDAGPPDASPSCVEARDHQELSWIADKVFKGNCGGAVSACHSSDTTGGKLALTADKAYAQLVGVDSKQVPAIKRVSPGSCENSYLYDKITNSADIKAGTKPMPLSNGAFQPLCQEKIDAICRWIEEGALDN